MARTQDRRFSLLIGLILCNLVGVPFCLGDDVSEILIERRKAILPGLNCVEIFGRSGVAKPWQTLDPAEMQVEVSGDACLMKDPSGLPTNPIMVVGIGATHEGSARIAVRYGDTIRHEQVFPVGNMEPDTEVVLRVDPEIRKHLFAGMGGGVMFYDNQWDLSDGDEIHRWCFEDVESKFLHVLIRPDHEPVNDNGDWRETDLSAFDFSSAMRALGIIRRAKQIRPSMSVYASLYSPPFWMKSNNDVSGEGTLRESHEGELGEYLFAWIRAAKEEGVVIDYLAVFNEPDFKHSQDGMHMADMKSLIGSFRETVDSLRHLAGKTESIEMPKLVFPDTLGPGAITRVPGNAKLFRGEAAILRDRVDVWGVHDYWDSGNEYWAARYEELRAFPGVGDKPIWMTEWAQRSPRGDLGSAMEYGRMMLNAIRKGAHSWMVFEWCHSCENQSGLISCDWYAKYPRQRYWRSKSYHVFRQIANTSPAGAHVVESLAKPGDDWNDRIEHLALMHKDRLIVHVFNALGMPVRLSLRMARKHTFLGGFKTTPERNMLPLKKLPDTIPANTLATLQFR